MKGPRTKHRLIAVIAVLAAVTTGVSAQASSLMGESSDVLAAARSGRLLLSTANPRLFGGKEYITTASANLLDFSARTYDPATLLFLTPDPLGEKYPHTYPNLYCLGNPVNFEDPTGMDPLFKASGDSIIMMTSDDGNSTGNSYIISGKTLKQVEKSLKNGNPVDIDYNSDNVVKIPSKETFDAVDSDIERSREYGRETGSHIYDDGTVFQWDIGSPPTDTESGKKLSIEFFHINGKQKIGNVYKIEAYWHIHPNIGDGFGSADPSVADKDTDTEFRKSYTGQTFVVGDRVGMITFYNGHKILLTTNFRKLKALAK